MALQAATAQPPEHGLRSDAECGRSALDRVAAVGPARRVGLLAVDLDGMDAPALAQQVNAPVLQRPAACRHDALGIENGGDLVVHLASRIELLDTALQQVRVGGLRVGTHSALYPVLAGRTGLPADLHPDHSGL